MPQARLAPFEPLSSYDAPGQIFSMLWDSELTVAGARNAIFSPARLTPTERDGILQRMKGDNRVVNTLIDIAGNPFVWMMFLTSPVASHAVGGGASSLMKVAEKYSPFVRENAPWFSAFGAMSLQQLFRGTPTTAALRQATRHLEEVIGEEAAILGPAYKRFLKAKGYATINPDSARLKPAQADELRRINNAIFASIKGWDREHSVPTFSRGTRDDGPQLVDVMVPKLVNADIEGELRAAGAIELRDAIKMAMKQRVKRLYGTDGLDEFVPDESKIFRLHRSLRNELFASSKESGKVEQAAQLIGENALEFLKTGDLTLDEFKTIVSSRTKALFHHDTFFPDTSFVYSRGGRKVSPGEVFEGRGRRISTQGPARTPSEQAIGGYDPDELQQLSDMFGGTEAMGEHINKMRAAISAANPTDPIRLGRINVEANRVKFFRDTGGLYAFHVPAVSEEVLQAQRETLGFADDTGLKLPETQVPMNMAFDEAAAKGLAPGDGFTIADALLQSFELMTDKTAKRALSHVAIPQVLGRQEIRSSAMRLSLLKGKEGLKALMEFGPFKQSLDDGGTWGQRVRERLERYADPEFALEESMRGQKALAKYFYSTHLGVNLGSVSLNAMQPFLLASTWLGPSRIAKAYPRAIGELFNYAQDRIGTHGFGPITGEVKQELIRKHFKYASAHDDLLGIVPDVHEVLDAPGFRSTTAEFQQKSYFDRVTEYLLKAFEKTEHLNRNVVAHATADFFAEAGRTANEPSVRSAIREMVEETQFGGSLLNTPLAFITSDPQLTKTGPLLNSPLMRQFLTFPLRSLTAFTAVGPKLGEGKRMLGITGIETDNPFAVLANDFLRSMGTSAVIYEVGKNVIGADLSRALFASSTTELVGGRRFIEYGDSPIPVPPVIDLAFNLVRAVATNDAALYGQSLPRLIPGGIAIARGLGTLPRVPPVGSIQKTYVDYNSPDEQGRVPVYKGDGSLIRYEDPRTLVLRGFGADLGRFQEAGQFESFLHSNIEEIREFKKKKIEAIFRNDLRAVKQLDAEFMKRFGMPLTISKSQLTQSLASRSVPRPERTLDRIAPEVRPLYQELAAQRGDFGLSPQALRGQQTSRQRSESRRLPAEAQEAAQRAQSFSSYQGF